jgi:hypothetical protein
MFVMTRLLGPRPLLRLFLAGVFLLPTSCSGRKPVYPVSGKVLFQGRPAKGAMVKFHPQDGSDTALVPRGEVDADGTFRLTTYQQHDGAPAGRYAVTIFWGVPSKGGDEFDRLLVPSRYLNPATSGLTAEVPNREIDLPPFQLTK